MLRTKTSLNDVIFVSMSTVLHDLFIFFKQKKIRKATFLLSHYWHPIASIVHPLPLFIEHWYYNITPSMDTCITYTRLCGILLSFLVFLPSGPIFFPYFFFLFLILKKNLLFQLLILSLPLTLFPPRRPLVLSVGHECVSRSRQDLRGSVDTNNVHSTIVAVSFLFFAYVLIFYLSLL